MSSWKNPGISRLLRVGGVAGALASGAISNFIAGQRAARLIDQDPPLPSKMPMYSLPYRKIGRRAGTRRGSRRFRIPRPPKSYNNGLMTMVRSTDIGVPLTITAAQVGYISADIRLNGVYTTDLVAAYRVYRIRKVVFHLIPRIDPGNSGVVNNYQAYVGACCDPEAIIAAPTATLITSYDNSYQKFINSGQSFNYTFYPKCSNTVEGAAGSTSAGSYGLNPWLKLTAAGIQVPHLSINAFVRLSANTTVTYDYYFDLHFDVKGQQ